MRKIRKKAAVITTALLLISFSLFPADMKKLISSWEPWEPYQYMQLDKVTGLDIQLLTAILNNMDYEVEFLERPWARQLVEIKMGKIDLTGGASKTPEREQYAYFSEPYRTESVVLYILKEKAGKIKISSLDQIAGSSFKLGVTRDYYYGEEYEKLLENPAFRRNLQEVTDEEINYKKLIGGRIDGFLGDPIVSTRGLKKNRLFSKVHVQFEVYSDDIYVMFSKKSTSPALVAKFNKSLSELKANGIHKGILNKYLR